MRLEVCNFLFWRVSHNLTDVHLDMSNSSGSTDVADNRPLIINDEIDLGYLFALLWRSKVYVFLITAFFVVASVIYAQSLPNLYKSQALLAPAADNSKAGNLPSQLGGLASIAGLTLGGSSTDKTTIALAILKSRTFLDAFVSRYHLEKPIMFAQAWDSSEKAWLYSEQHSKPETPKFSSQKLYKKLTGEILVAAQDPKTGLVRLSIELMSPIESQRWLELLIRDLNSEMRQRDIHEAKQRITFLRQQLEKTEVAQMQQIFYQLIEQQLKTVMLAEVGDEYVFKVIDKPVVPEEKSKPHKALIVATGSLSGVFVAVIIVVFVSIRKRRN